MSNTVTSTIAAPSRGWRGWLRFRLRSMLILMTAAAVWLGWELHHLRQRDAAIKRLQKAGFHPVIDSSPMTPRAVLARVAGLNAQANGDYLIWRRREFTTQTAHDISLLGPYSSIALHGADVSAAEMQVFARACNPKSLLIKDISLAVDATAVIGKWRQLDFVQLINTDVTDRGLDRMAGLRALKTLIVHNQGIPRPGAGLSQDALRGHGFEAWSHDTPLQILWLYQCPVDDRGAAAIGRFRRLSELRLVNGVLTDEGLAHIGTLSQLDMLHIDSKNLTGPGFTHLARLASLATLSLSDSSLDDAGLEGLSTLVDLRSLSAARTQITDAGAGAIARLRSVQVLVVSGCNLHDAALAEFARLDDLFMLDLQGCPVTDAGLAYLARLKHLEQLHIVGTKVTPAGVARLKAALPEMEVDY